MTTSEKYEMDGFENKKLQQEKKKKARNPYNLHS